MEDDKEWEFKALVTMFQNEWACLEKAMGRDGVGAPEGLLCMKGEVTGNELNR